MAVAVSVCMPVLFAYQAALEVCLSGADGRTSSCPPQVQERIKHFLLQEM